MFNVLKLTCILNLKLKLNKMGYAASLEVYASKSRNLECHLIKL